MSSNGEKRMMKRSDFAQKLLDDLRVRKEQLSSSQNSLPTKNYAYSNKGFKGSRAKSKIFQDLTSGCKEPSNQIVPYGKGRSMEKLDLSQALAFALENARKALRTDPSGNASIISFLHDIGKRSLGEGRSSQCLVQQQQKPSSRSPMIHVHIKEISKGTQKLNQIIKACNNSMSFRKGKCSIQCGEQLMEGAVELEHSLRLLVDIQQASEYTTNKQRRNRIKLLGENDEEEEEDAHIRNYEKIKQVAKADIEMRLLALSYSEDKKNNECNKRSLKPQKGRIPSVVAKLMGLGEFPEDEKETKNIYEEKHMVMQVSENVVEMKAQRNSTSLDLVIHKETQNVNAINHKGKSHEQRDIEKDDSNNRKRNKVSHKKDGEMTTKDVQRRNPSPTENKHKVVTRSQQKPLHKLSFEKKLNFHNSEEEKSIKKEKLRREVGVMTNHSPKHLSSVDKQRTQPHEDKSKALRKSFSHAKAREKKNQESFNPNDGLCKVMKQPEIKIENQLLRSFNESNKKAEAKAYIKTSQVSDVEVPSSNRNVEEHKRDIKDDSIMLITVERVPCQDPSENQHHVLMFTDGLDQHAPVSKCDGNSDRLSNKIYKGTKGELEAGLSLLKKPQEHRKRENKETLSEIETNLKKIFVKSQLFLNTAEALFKLNIPLNVLHDSSGGNNYYQEDKNLILDCGFEVMKRIGRFQELSAHPFVKVPISSSKVNSLDNLVKQLCKELEKLRAYSRDSHTGSHVDEDYVLERDVHHKDPNLNSMWDMGWNNSMLAFIEKDDVMRDIEREVFRGLMEEITRDLICI